MFSTFNNHFNKPMMVIHPGEYYSSRDDIIISTVLGSCVSVVLHDPIKAYCGMNHFMLPGTIHKMPFEEETGRYGILAMELLINDMLKKGSKKANLEAKVFGGGHVINNSLIRNPSAASTNHHHSIHNPAHTITPGLVNSIPASNIHFAYSFLEAENIPMIAHDTGGTCGRKILLFTTNSQVLLKRFHGALANQAAGEELEYLRRLRSQRRAGLDITLF